MANTLTEQLDALIAAHDLSALSITRISGTHGLFWSISAQGSGTSAGADYGTVDLSAAVAEAIVALNAKRAIAVVVPELACAA